MVEKISAPVSGNRVGGLNGRQFAMAFDGRIDRVGPDGQGGTGDRSGNGAAGSDGE
jgi:hypothetical protein